MIYMCFIWHNVIKFIWPTKIWILMKFYTFSIFVVFIQHYLCVHFLTLGQMLSRCSFKRCVYLSKLSQCFFWEVRERQDRSGKNRSTGWHTEMLFRWPLRPQTARWNCAYVRSCGQEDALRAAFLTFDGSFIWRWLFGIKSSMWWNSNSITTTRK